MSPRLRNRRRGMTLIEVAVAMAILGLMGIIAYGVFTFIASLVVWSILKAVMGIRVGEEEEITGLDMSELGMEAYPDFTKG